MLYHLAEGLRLQLSLMVAAITARNSSSIISTSRHALPQLVGLTSRQKVLKGAYVLEEVKDIADLTLIGSGAELNLAYSVARELRTTHSLKVRVVSSPW